MIWTLNMFYKMYCFIVLLLYSLPLIVFSHLNVLNVTCNLLIYCFLYLQRLWSVFLQLLQKLAETSIYNKEYVLILVKYGNFVYLQFYIKALDVVPYSWNIIGLLKMCICSMITKHFMLNHPDIQQSVLRYCLLKTYYRIFWFSANVFDWRSIMLFFLLLFFCVHFNQSDVKR